MNKMTKRTLIFSFIHFTVLITCIVVSFSIGMSKFDAGDVNESIIELITEAIANILIVPAYFIWTPWASKNLPNYIEWMLFISNSVLWGYIGAIVYSKFKNPHNQQLKHDARKARAS